jgi:hypothetical protein
MQSEKETQSIDRSAARFVEAHASGPITTSCSPGRGEVFECKPVKGSELATYSRREAAIPRAG